MSAQTQSELEAELKQAKNDLLDARQRIERIEKVLWGNNPHGMDPDPNAMVTILRDIRDNMPDLKVIKDNYKFLDKLRFFIWGNAGILAVIGSIWAAYKFISPLL